MAHISYLDPIKYLVRVYCEAQILAHLEHNAEVGGALLAARAANGDVIVQVLLGICGASIQHYQERSNGKLSEFTGRTTTSKL